MVCSLADYLNLKPDGAREQWRRIATRVSRARQEHYLPVEVIITYALFWLVDPHGFGGGNIHRLPEPVIRLAETLRRTPGSLTNKMLNLEGARENCARVEPELYIRLSSEPDLFLGLYRLAVLAAREEGFGTETVPDVLGVVDRHLPLVLLGQDELGFHEIRQALQEQVEEVGRIERAFLFTEEETTRLVVQRVRLGQHRFARAVLAAYDHQCGFCGFAPRGLPGQGLLVASHIKPWARSSNRERHDPRNGIAACPTHDHAFDAGLLTVNGGMRIHQAVQLAASVVADQGVSHYFGADILQQRLVLPPGTAGPRPDYLRFHREHVFQGDAAHGLH